MFPVLRVLPLLHLLLVFDALVKLFHLVFLTLTQFFLPEKEKKNREKATALDIKKQSKEKQEPSMVII